MLPIGKRTIVFVDVVRREGGVREVVNKGLWNKVEDCRKHREK